MTTSSTISIIQQATRTALADLPQSLVDGLAALTVATPRFDDSDLGDALADAVLAGRNPAADRRVQAALTAHQLARANAEAIMGAALDRRREALLREHADDLMDTWRGVVERAQSAVDVAREAIGTERIDFSDAASRVVPPTILPAWQQARLAVEQAARIADGWSALGGLVAHVSPTPDQTWMIFTELSATEFDEIRYSGGGTTLVRLVEQGHRLDFASWAQFAERLAKDRATAQQQREQEANVYTGSHW